VEERREKRNLRWESGSPQILIGECDGMERRSWSPQFMIVVRRNCEGERNNDRSRDLQRFQVVSELRCDIVGTTI
jgi:hypothetical protein